MDADAADVFRTVEYRGNSWIMDRVPWSLFGVFMGVGLLVYTDARLLAWFVIILCAGFIAYAVSRQFIPTRPMLKLSPAGISVHLRFLKDTLIPWHEVKDIAGLDLTGPHGPPDRNPDVPAVLISNEFYEQHLLPKRRTWEKPLAEVLDFILVPSTHLGPMMLPGEEWDFVFRPKGALMQMALPHYTWFKIEPRDIREPVEARWKAFRDRPAATTSVPGTSSRTADEPSRGAVQVYGRRPWQLTPWRTIQYIAALTGILAVLTNAIELWDTPGLRDAREEVAKKTRRVEEARKEQLRIRNELKRSNEAAEERRRQSEELERTMQRMMNRP